MSCCGKVGAVFSGQSVARRSDLSEDHFYEHVVLVMMVVVMPDKLSVIILSGLCVQ